MDGIALVRADGTVFYASPALDRILGYTLEEVGGGLRMDLIHPDDQLAAMAEWARLHAAPGSVVTGEHRVLHKDGSWRWLEMVSQNLLADPALGAIVTNYRDITDRKRVEEALRQSEERARAQFKGIPLPTYAWRRVGEEFVLVDYSDAAEAVTRGAIESLKGSSARELFPDLPEIVGDFERCLAERTAVRRRLVSYRYRSTGEIRSLESVCGFVPPDTVLCHTEDITELLEVQEALRARVRQQAAVAELGQRALTGLELPTLMDEAVAAVAQTLGVEYCKTLELCPQSGALLLRSGVGWKEGCVGRAIVSAGEASWAATALLMGGPLIVEDLGVETRFSPPPLLVDHGVVSGMSVVIPGPERPFGVLGAYTKGKRTFLEDDVHFLQAVANVLAGAILRRREEEVRVELLHRLISAQDEERRRIARELHDQTGQSLTSLLVGLRALKDARSLKEAKAGAERLRAVASEVLEDLGRLSRGLHPAVLDDLGLAPAIARQAREQEDIHGFPIEVDLEGLGAERLPPGVERALYRAVQETLTNVSRHAHARHVRISLKRDGPAVELTVRDDGVGFDVGAALGDGGASERLGLLGMRERAVLLGGKLEIESERRQGTTVRMRLPLQAW